MGRNAIGNNQHIQFLQNSYATQGSVTVNPAPSSKQLFLFSFSAYNGNASSMDVGLAISRANQNTKLFTLVSGGATDVTATIQAGTAVTLFTTVNNDGFLLESPKQFGYASFNVSQVSTGSPVYSYQYYNGASFVTLPVTQAPVYSSTGMVHIAFNPPIDWVAGDGGLTSGTRYSIKVRATTAPTQAVKANSVRTAAWLYYERSLASLGRVQSSFSTHPLMLEAGEALLPYFNVADAQNVIEAAYQVSP